jgi:hypothetical protein
MKTSEILERLRNDPFRLGEFPNDLAQYEQCLVRAFEAGVAQGKREACATLAEAIQRIVLPEPYPDLT